MGSLEESGQKATKSINTPKKYSKMALLQWRWRKANIQHGNGESVSAESAEIEENRRNQHMYGVSAEI